MAIRELQSVIQSNVNVAKDTSIHAGQPVMKDTSGLAVLADRGSFTALTFPGKYIGLAADDTARTGNTMIGIDPVGSAKLDAAGNFVASNNGFFSCTKRALADYQSEIVNNVTDLVSGSTGYQGPRRGLGVYTTPSSQFIVDQTVVGSAQKKTSAADADIAEDAAWTVNTLLTIGTSSNASGSNGFLVRLTDATHSVPVARVDKVEGSGSGILVYITLL